MEYVTKGSGPGLVLLNSYTTLSLRESRVVLTHPRPLPSRGLHLYRPRETGIMLILKDVYGTGLVITLGPDNETVV